MLKKMLMSLVVLGALQGCATVGVDQMTVTGSMVTSARNGYPFDEIAVKEVSQRNSVIVITHLKWEPLDQSAGTHTATWSWYANGKLVVVRKRDIRFAITPFRLSWRMPAADFAPGHYRVDVALDDKVIDTHEVDIIN